MRRSMGMSLWIFIAGFIVAFFGFVLHVTGMSTTEWSSIDSSSARGAFRSCAAGDCQSNEDPNSDEQTVMAMNIISIILAMVGMCLAVLHIALEVLQGGPIKYLPLVSGCLCVAGFMVNIIGVVVWGVVIHTDLEDLNSQWDIGYSLVLSIIGGIFYLVGGVLMFVGDTYICTTSKDPFK